MINSSNDIISGKSTPSIAIKLAPHRLMNVFYAVSFVIYLFVSVFKSNLPLILIDVLAGFALILTLDFSSRKPIRLLGGSRMIMMWLGLYFFSIILSFLAEDSGSLISKLQGIRSLSFGLFFLILSSVWINSLNRIDSFIKIYLWGSLCAAAFGFRQLIFGLLPYEMERLSLFGGSVLEIETLQRIRIPGIFGDPATFSFVMMSSLLILPIIIYRPIFPKILRRRYLFILIILLSGLFMSLVRGPLVALAIAFFFLILFRRHRLSIKIAQIAGIVFVFVLSTSLMNKIVLNGILERYDNAFMRNAEKIITSLWTTIPLGVDLDSLTWQQRNLKTISIGRRQSGWKAGLSFINNNPFGGGIGAITEGRKELEFSPVDVGFMRFGIDLGWPGLISMLGLWLSILIVGLKKLRHIKNTETFRIGNQLIALWVAFSISLIGTTYLHTEILGATVWTIAGILINLDVIAKKEKIEAHLAR